MKQQISMAALCVLLALPGCKEQAAPTSVTVGPFRVNRDTGLADGQAFGVDFQAMGASSSEVEFKLSGNSQHSSSTSITLGDDLKIELRTMKQGSSVAFQLNGKEVCNLARGDQVVIDEERNVTVNGGAPPK